MTPIFRSKVDGRLKWIGILMPCTALAALFGAQPGNRLLWIPVGTVCLATVLVSWILMSTYYELSREQLIAHCGPFTWRIALADICEIRESNSVRSGPALSMDRLEITCRGGKVLLISPADKAGFLGALRQRAPHL
jgi:PH (Pleckstrin Homology) domain-containing protein